MSGSGCRGKTQPVVAGRPPGAGWAHPAVQTMAAAISPAPMPSHSTSRSFPSAPAPCRCRLASRCPAACETLRRTLGGGRVILNRLSGTEAGKADLSELTYLLDSGSDRIGALDFQASPSKYVPRAASVASLENLMNAARLVEEGVPLPPDSRCRPAAWLIDRRRATEGADRRPATRNTSPSSPPAPTSTASSRRSSSPWRLAALAGIDAAPVKLAHVAGKDVLLIPPLRSPQGRSGLAAPGHGLGAHPSRARRNDGALRQLSGPGDHRPPSLHRSQADLARTILPHRLQHPLRQHRRPRAQPRRLLGLASCR